MLVAGRHRSSRVTSSRDERKGHINEVNRIKPDEAFRKEGYILQGEI